MLKTRHQPGKSSCFHRLLPPLALSTAATLAACATISAADARTTGSAARPAGNRRMTAAPSMPVDSDTSPPSDRAVWPPVMARYTSARISASSSAPCSWRWLLSTPRRLHLQVQSEVASARLQAHASPIVIAAAGVRRRAARAISSQGASRRPVPTRARRPLRCRRCGACPATGGSG